MFQENASHKNEALSAPCSTLNNVFTSYLKVTFKFQNFILPNLSTNLHPTYLLRLAEIPSPLNIFP